MVGAVTLSLLWATYSTRLLQLAVTCECYVYIVHIIIVSVAVRGEHYIVYSTDNNFAPIMTPVVIAGHNFVARLESMVGGRHDIQ